jgi:transcriptional regulator with XRE-family HTH domain
MRRPSGLIYYITMDIPHLVAAARRQAGLTQQELAQRAGTSQPAVARIERGGGNPSLATVRRLVNAAGFDLRLELAPRAVHRDAVVASYKRDVDRTLLRENLGKSVDRRLRDMEAFRKDAERLRDAATSARRRK